MPSPMAKTRDNVGNKELAWALLHNIESIRETERGAEIAYMLDTIEDRLSQILGRGTTPHVVADRTNRPKPSPRCETCDVHELPIDP